MESPRRSEWKWACWVIKVSICTHKAKVQFCLTSLLTYGAYVHQMLWLKKKPVLFFFSVYKQNKIISLASFVLFIVNIPFIVEMTKSD